MFWFGNIFKTPFLRFAIQSDINTDIKTVLLFYMDRFYIKNDNIFIALCHWGKILTCFDKRPSLKVKWIQQEIVSKMAHEILRLLLRRTKLKW